MDLLADLTPAQREAVTSEAAPLCILAGAGSGKTRVLTRRIAHRLATGSADPRHVLALTFTRKAAGELGDRLRALGVRDRLTAGTFHAVAWAQLRQRGEDRGEAVPALLDRKARILAALTAGRHGAEEVPVGSLAAEIEWAQARLIGPDGYARAVVATGRRVPLPAEEMAGIYARYRTEKRRRGVVDFEDLLARLAGAMEEDAAFAAAQRWRWRHLFVDEYQDVNPLQHRLLLAWLGDRSDLCVVGDPYQAIYAWNGADPTLLERFCDHHPGAEVVRLHHNHRSSPQVVAAARAVLGESVPAGTPVARSTRPDGPTASVTRYDSEQHEARGVASSLRLRHGPGVAWSHLAVLARTNAQLAVVDRALRLAGIPSRVSGGGLLRRPEVTAALALLTARPGAGRRPLAGCLPDLIDLAAAEPDDERRQSLELLVGLGRDQLQIDPSASVDAFSSWLTVNLGADRGGPSGPGADAVTLSTFHRAKGLEWPVVYLVGLEDGLVPLGRDLEEERRLLYVGVTRAEVEVHCSWAARRSFGAKPVPRRPSPWLAAIEALAEPFAARNSTGGAPRPAPPVEFRATRERLRQTLIGDGSGREDGGAEGGEDVEVLAALQDWRRRAARAAQVAPYVVCHDATLAALATARPGSTTELLAVPGLGPVKAARYGDALLALVARRGRSA